jgi:hypothetical protein
MRIIEIRVSRHHHVDLTHSLTHLAEPIIVHDLHEFLGLVAQLEIFQFKITLANLIFLVKNTSDASVLSL